ncbi:unnamed protein product [Rotaria sordida]|uniref:Protein NO VEIN C-terminal domain-containing protein n=1 Tax=Rotaria sordida TaxID=392033 RepID=A0A816AWR2_9BILA|nr:unnamed protein product [Rotaria sordida]CAF1601090.1 unnamed protein product [Rotaria sordida]
MISDEDDIVQNLNEEVDEEYLLKIGRKREELIFKYLTDLYHNNENVSIEWLNETSEIGLSYDIKINFIDESEKPHQIEVKTTSKPVDNYQFSVSIQEVVEILKNPTTYYIYRVNLTNRSLTITEDIKLNLSNKRQLELKVNVLTTNDLDSRK